ncbi:MAG TPA: phosphoglucosamine mutase, partial [Candidatus Thermoplasmatota archaeon]|nr:phosphoglucosamine mutase [Candidatus Thermoplasmatota archaeon]
RRSGDMLEAALAAGLTARGVEVVHLGVIPTPGVSYLTRHLRASAGIVISASHNPFEDNGIKFFAASGEKLPDSLEADIEARLGAPFDEVSGVSVGTVEDYHEAERLYCDFLAEHAPELRGMRVALDCANGATFRVAPRVFQRAGASVFAMYTAPDGRNINLGCGSTHPEHLQRLVRQEGYDLGIAFDGDGDRAILVDGNGEVVHGDHILYMTALHRREKAVVATLMSNMGLEVKLREAGIELERTAVGDRYVHERLLERGLSLGGEQSGHVLFLDIAPTGDGILTALRALAALRDSGASLAEWRDRLPMFPQTLVNVRVNDKHGLGGNPTVQDALRAAEGRMAGRGRINLRPSGTEPLVRVMVEGPDESEIAEIAQSVAAAVRAADGAGA